MISAFTVDRAGGMIRRSLFAQRGAPMKLLRTCLVTMAVIASSIAVATPGSAQDGNACWGQASAAFAQLGVMGEHASSFESPRLGLRNLARDLHSMGALPDDSLRSLGIFVAEAEELSIEACQ